MTYEIEQIVPNFKGHSEGVLFDITDDGAILIVFFNNPSKEEISQFESGNKFEIRFISLDRVMMITAKIGGLDWLDAPYSPHLSKHLSAFVLPNENEGLALQLYLVDTSTGKIKHMRLIGLSERFSRRFIGETMKQKLKDGFNLSEYNNTISKIFATYNTKQIVKMSSDYCKVN